MNELKDRIAKARGSEKAELVLKNATVFHAFTGEFKTGDVAIEQGIILGVGSYEGKEEIDLHGKYLVPGFIDSHIHIESSMLSPLEFARAVVPLGTTTVIADPHEIANVAGLRGVEYLLQATEKLPLNTYFMLPSCVPATHLEHAGAQLLAKDLAALIDHPRVLGLGEMMNYPGVLFGDETVMEKLQMAANKKIDGHAPEVHGNDLMAYAAGGIGSDHECFDPEQALEKLRAGMHVMIREGSAAKNLQALLPMIDACTAPFCSLAADDRHPADLLEEGHINHMVRMAVDAGAELPLILQMATIHAARHFGLHDLGAIAPLYRADLLVFDDLDKWVPSIVFKDGKIVAQNNKACFGDVTEELPTDILNTMHVKDFSQKDLVIHAKGDKVHVIGLVPQQIITRHLIQDAELVEGQIQADVAKDLLKLVVFERHKKTGNIGLGLVHGYGLQKGAVASTIAHDSHNLIVIGTNDADIELAAKTLMKEKGGICLVAEGKVEGVLPLPIAGLMSTASVREVEDVLGEMKKKAYAFGVHPAYDPFLTLAFLSLPVIPELKLTDCGLVDVQKFSLLPLTQ